MGESDVPTADYLDKTPVQFMKDAYDEAFSPYEQIVDPHTLNCLEELEENGYDADIGIQYPDDENIYLYTPVSIDSAAERLSTLENTPSEDTLNGRFRWLMQDDAVIPGHAATYSTAVINSTPYTDDSFQTDDAVSGSEAVTFWIGSEINGEHENTVPANEYM